MFDSKHFMLIAFCLMLSAQNLFSQILIQGTVTDNGGEYLGSGAEPIVNALVTVTDQADAGRSFSAYTNEQGQYTIQITQTGIDDNPSNKPCNFKLLQNYPNPFNPSTVIGYELLKPSHLTIEIYNVLGRKVKTLLDGFQSISGQVVWDATNSIGQGVSAGMYIYSMQAGDVRFNKKMLLIDGQQDQISTIPSQTTGSVSEVQHQTVLSKTMSDQYTLQITGADIAPYEQQNIEITGDLTVYVKIARIVTDIDGNVYQTVKIGDQWWIAENLKVTHYRNGDPIPNVTSYTEWYELSTGAWCVYDNNVSYSDTYGYLYNWYAVNDSGNIAPTGWHVPSDEEWLTLVDYLGRSEAGAKIKETGTGLWSSPFTGTNESGFSALPGGMREGLGYYSGRSMNAYFWTSTEYDNYHVWYRHLMSLGSMVSRSNRNKLDGLSIRCIRD